MATPWGVTSTGYVPKTQQQILSEEVTQAQGLIQAGLDLSPISPTGQELAIGAEKSAEVWEVGAPAYNATNRGAAEGAQLDNIGALTGCKRLPATFSTVWCLCVFSQAGTFAAGALVGFIAGLSSQQASNATTPVTSTAPVALTGTVAVVNGSTTVTFSAAQTLPQGAAIVFASQNTVAYFLAAPMSGTNVGTLTQAYAGTSAGATSAQNYYSQSVLFQAPLVGANFANALIAANANSPGNLGAFTGQLPVTGWFSVVDENVPTIGSQVETDTAYRVRQQQDLGAQGSCNLAAIQVDVVEALQAAPSPVIATVAVYENTGDYIDSNGLLPHSYQVIVFDGVNPNTAQNNPIIGQAIWNNKPAGLKPYGTTSVTVLDSQGVQRSVSFTRPTQLPTYLIYNVEIASTADPNQVATLIAAAAFAAAQGQPYTAYGATVAPPAGSPTTLLPGVDVVPAAFGGLAQAQAGVVAVDSVLAGFAPNPTSSAVLRTPRGSVAVLTGVVVNCVVFKP